MGTCSPRKIFWKFDVLRWLLRPFLGLKTSLANLGMITEFASRPHTWRLVSIGIGCFRYPLKPGKEAAHESQSIFCYSGSYSEQLPSRMCGHHAHNLLVRSSLLCLDRKVCGWYACFSPASEGSATSSQSKHWSGDCQVCQTCSTCPVREKWMRKRNSTVEIIQESKFKFQKLTEKVGRPRPPQPPHFWWPWSGWAMNITELLFLYRGHRWCKLLQRTQKAKLGRLWTITARLWSTSFQLWSVSNWVLSE